VERGSARGAPVSPAPLDVRPSPFGRPVEAVCTGVLLAVALALGGCAQAPRPLYHWDRYQTSLYEHFKADGKGPDEQLRALQAQAEKARGLGAALPPGFRAHLAMVYLQLDRPDEARAQLEAEKAAFPESARYMDFLLARLDGTPQKS
jgi:hypothetical protein